MLEIVYRKLEELKPFPRNPYKHSREQIERLVKSIKTFGFTSPILISQGDMIIAGHARREAAKLLEMEEAPTIFIDLPYNEAVAYVIADNQLAKLAGEDNDLLTELLQEISENQDLDIEAIGFSEEEIDALLTGPEEEELKDLSGSTEEKWEIVISCESEDQQEELYQKFKEEGYNCRVLTF